MDFTSIVAIDGPAGSGKSSVGRAVAQYLGYGFLPTGSYYRAFAFLLDQTKDLDSQLDSFISSVRNDLDPYNSGFNVHIDDSPFFGSSGISASSRNIASELNNPEITSKTAAVARNKSVRVRLNEYFRKLCSESIYPAIVLEGRDATTVIAPNARVKIFLTASLVKRAARRSEQLSSEPPNSVLEALRQRDEADNAVTDFLSDDSSRITLDTSDLTFSESVARVLEVIEQAGMPFVSDKWVGENADVLAASGELGATVVIVGRPNVGKSALVNCILGRREAVVENRPGVTRDRVVYPAFWAGRPFTLVDTGGWECDAEGLDAEVVAQAEIGMSIADIIIFVVDVQHGPVSTDAVIARNLQRQNKPIFLVANKADNASSDSDVAQFWSLGLGQPYACSATHGRGVADLMDIVMQSAQVHTPSFCSGAPRVALIGRPNVGKSSLINQLTNSRRAIVDDLAGTTRDPLDALAVIGDKSWLFVDTAGLRRKFKSQKGADFYAYLRATTVLRRTEIALLLLDASHAITEQDVRIAEMVVESGRALVIAINKWDLLDEERRYWLEREIDNTFFRFAWAPRVNISARTGRGVKQLAVALQTALTSWNTRLNTARVNHFLQRITREQPHPTRGGRRPRILFASQTGVAPPTFTLFTTGFLEPTYRRFLQKSIRSQHSFTGSPIILSVKIRTSRNR